MPPARLTAKLTRHRNRPETGGETLFFKIEMGRLGEFVRPEAVPDFEGEEAWFELERVPAGNGRPWPTWRVIRQVEARNPWR